tara:strand:- start:4265 stop:6778 length:2514 start_codon:yes stop_codon:yes gene_type:complete
MWLTLGKELLKSGVKAGSKKVATDKLLNRQKKKPKKRRSAKEVSEGIMNRENDRKRKKGGALAVRPAVGLVPTAKDFDPISTTPGESDVVIIKKQLIQVKDILKDSRSVKEAERKNLRKALEKEKREKREEKLEKVKPTQPKTGIKMPNPLGGGIGNFFAWVAFGVLLNKLWEFLPALTRIGRILGPIVNFIKGVVEKTFDFIVGFITAAYEGMDFIGDKIEEIAGEDARNKFDRFAKLFTQVMNGALIAAQVALAVALFKRPRTKLPDVNKPKDPNKPRTPLEEGRRLNKFDKLNRRRTTTGGQQLDKGRFSRIRESLRKIRNRIPFLGPQVSKGSNVFTRNLSKLKPFNNKISKGSNVFTRNLSKLNLFNNKVTGGLSFTETLTETTKKISDQIKNIDPKETIKNLQKTEVGKTLTETTKKISEAVKDPKETIKNLQKTEVGKNVTETVKSVTERGEKWVESFKKIDWTPGFLKEGSGFRKGISGAKKSVVEGFKGAREFIQELPKKTLNFVSGIRWGELPYVKEAQAMYGGITEAMAKEWGKLMELNPKKFIENQIKEIRPIVEKIMKENQFLKGLGEITTKKGAMDFVGTQYKRIVDKVAPLAKQIRGSKHLKGLTNIFGPVDIVIDSIFAIIDYNFNNESPINAIVRSLAGTLGFAAGAAGGAALGTTITAAAAGTGVGAPAAAAMVPMIPYITFGMGMGGAWVGEQLASVILGQVVKNIPGIGDIDDPLAASLGLTPRKLIRDPSTPLPVGISTSQLGEKREEFLGKELIGKVDEKDEIPTEGKGPLTNIMAPHHNKNQKSQGLDVHPSYAHGSMMVVRDTTTIIQPIEVG